MKTKGSHHTIKHDAPWVLVTGAAKRIGRSIALMLADHGYRIVVHYHHSADEAAATVNDIRKKDVEAVAIKANLSDKASIASLWESLDAQHITIAHLINNASTFSNDTITSLNAASFDQHMHANTLGPVLMIQHFYARLGGDQTGSAVNIIDHAVLRHQKGFLSYMMSKAALQTATESLALECAPNVRVNAVGPGHIMKASFETDEHFSRLQKASPISGPIPPEAIAQAVCFLIHSPYITGHMIPVDGGMWL